MMFVFGYLGTKMSAPGSPPEWPVALMHATEMVLLAIALASLLLACLVVRPMRTVALRDIVSNLVAIIGGVSAGVALIMPIELAPFFFGARGELMMVTLVLILFYPGAAVIFFLLLLKIMTPPRATPPQLPAA